MDDFCISDQVLTASDGSTLASESTCSGVSYCSADDDADDICDLLDDCVGAYDDCGDCNGDNAADLGCGCDEPAPSGCDDACGSTLELDEWGV